MDFDEIEFTEWQIEKVRVALNNYRIANARNGRLPSWTQVRDDIVCSDINIDKYSEDDAELAFKPEALRRFAARITVLGVDRLKDVARFLIHSKIISAKQLDEEKSSLHQMLAAHQYLAIKTDIARDFIKYIGGAYTASVNSLDDMHETMTLNFTPDPSGEFVRVEEIYEFSAADLSDKKTRQERESYTNLRIVRTGYGLIATDNIILHIFLSGAERFISRATYVQVGHLNQDNFPGHICLLRSGSRKSIGQRAEILPEGIIHSPNIFKFSPAVDKPKYRISLSIEPSAII
ncbi:hypothetical protein FGL97_12005 [Pseudomonas putida]|uniref:hypothetical protein n=1 Tax=Pseudomonas putida TaxID=303 RepID=UPI00159D2F93|nr:hypothetical protein [Pseudomonas putida]NVN63931.1 hypothetical protein [Pseudomonas putida]NVN68881.1 hypothetical protein [Pseudomonas putida]